MGKLCKEYMGSFCITSYNCIPIYNYVKMTYLIKIVFSNILSTQSYILTLSYQAESVLKTGNIIESPHQFLFCPLPLKITKKSEKWEDQRVLKRKQKQKQNTQPWSYAVFFN